MVNLPNTITVVGLGPGGKKYLTVEALERIKEYDILYLRTKKHPIVDFIEKQGVKIISFDDMYDKFESFDEVYKTIVDELIELSSNKDIIYGVPGNPFVAERTVQLLIDINEKNKDMNLDFIPGTSFIDAILNTIKKDPVNGLSIIDGLQINTQRLNPKLDIIITQVYNKLVASEVKLKLMEYYDDEYEITVIRAAGIEGQEKLLSIPLYELDRLDIFDHLTSIFIPKIGNNIKIKYQLNDLVDIMTKLRSEDGCPWDRKQTHESLRPYLIEECYEVLEALEKEDMALLEEELGDLLLQVVFHSQLTKEQGYFDISDVIGGICTKLINRHPHVFADTEVKSSEQVLKNWEEIKRNEKDEKSYTESLERIPKSMPALMKSYKIQAKAAKVGFDWDDVEGAVLKVKEELKELLDVYKTNKREEIYEEIGDLLFAVVNMARFLEVRPELALNNTVNKFIRRFRYIEETSMAKGLDLKEMTLEEMDKLWNEAKKIDKNT